ncbi:hypothetical protein [uncultured Tistrella sp.]|uniref:hypothetical protein n=1 Tax=Tistrella mobilis TaxID=171437 RepID=UPI0026069AC5|nr:hypothetical protein [uncultured Tistrella sp.]
MPARSRKTDTFTAGKAVFKATGARNCAVSLLASDWVLLSGKAMSSGTDTDPEDTLIVAIEVLDAAVRRRALQLTPRSAEGAALQAELIGRCIRAAADPEATAEDRRRALALAATGLRHLTDYLTSR